MCLFLLCTDTDGWIPRRFSCQACRDWCIDFTYSHLFTQNFHTFFLTFFFFFHDFIFASVSFVSFIPHCVLCQKCHLLCLEGDCNCSSLALFCTTRSTDDRGGDKESIPVYSHDRKNKGQRKRPDVIKLKACAEYRPLLHSKGLAQHQGGCDYSEPDRGRGRGDEVKRQSEERKRDDIWGREHICHCGLLRVTSVGH